MTDTAIQEQIPHNQCFGCGKDNHHGLRIKSYWRPGEEAVCEFMPEPYMTAGPPQFLNGGIIATLLDCHAICTAVAARYAAEGRPIGAAPYIWCVTASMNIQYRRPTPINKTVTVRARIGEVDGRKTTVECTLESEGKERAHGTVLAVEVGSEWRGY